MDQFEDPRRQRSSNYLQKPEIGHRVEGCDKKQKTGFGELTASVPRLVAGRLCPWRRLRPNRAHGLLRNL